METDASPKIVLNLQNGSHPDKCCLLEHAESISSGELHRIEVNANNYERRGAIRIECDRSLTLIGSLNCE